MINIVTTISCITLTNNYQYGAKLQDKIGRGCHVSDFGFVFDYTPLKVSLLDRPLEQPISRKSDKLALNSLITF